MTRFPIFFQQLPANEFHQRYSPCVLDVIGSNKLVFGTKKNEINNGSFLAPGGITRDMI